VKQCHCKFRSTNKNRAKSIAVSNHQAKYLGLSLNRPSQRRTQIIRSWRAMPKDATLTRVCTLVWTITRRTLIRWVRQKRKTQSRFNTSIKSAGGQLMSIISFWKPCASTAKTGIRSRSMWSHAVCKTFDLTHRSSTRNLKNWLMLKAICLQESIGTSKRWLVLTSMEVLHSISSCSWRGRKKML